MTTETINPVIQAGLATMNFSRGATLKLLESIPEDSRTLCPLPGANHATFVAGHVAMTDEYFLGAAGGQQSTLPEEWGKLFGMGVTLTENTSDYPAWDELISAMADRREALINWFSGMDDAKLAEALPESVSMFAPTYGALMPSIAWHEGFHAGQLSAVRKKLGQGSLFG